MLQQTRIFLVDNSLATRKGLAAILHSDYSNIVVGEAGSAEEMFEKITGNLPEIVILDLEMPGMGGEKALSELKIRYPEIKVVIYSMYFESWLIDKLINEGACGFIPKGCDDELILLTLNSIKQNDLIDNKLISETLIGKLKDINKIPFLNRHGLSEKELAILNNICLCKSNKQIAHDLKITERTVEFHKTNIYKKTGIDNCGGLIIYSIKEGLLRL